MLSIREVQISDAPRLSEIYSFYVKNTAVSFEYVVPAADEFEKRIKNTTEKYPYLVCVDDGKVVGYAYAGAYSTRQAYDWTATTSIYVDKEYRRKGMWFVEYRTKNSANYFRLIIRRLIAKDFSSSLESL